MLRTLFLAAVIASAGTTASCSKRSSTTVRPGEPLKPPAYLTDHAELDALEGDRIATRAMTADDFEKRYALPFREGLGYAPLEAKGLELIATKEGPLAADERSRLSRDGFVLRSRAHTPTFARVPRCLREASARLHQRRFNPLCDAKVV